MQIISNQTAFHCISSSVLLLPYISACIADHPPSLCGKTAHSWDHLLGFHTAIWAQRQCLLLPPLLLNLNWNFSAPHTSGFNSSFSELEHIEASSSTASPCLDTFFVTCAFCLLTHNLLLVQISAFCKQIGLDCTIAYDKQFLGLQLTG